VRKDLELREHITQLGELVAARTAALAETQAQLEQAIAERKQARAEQERLLAAERAQSRRQVALLRLSAELAATLDEAQVCWRVVGGVCETLGYDQVALLMLDETTGDRVLAAHAGHEKVIARMQPGKGLSELPLLDGQLHYTPDVRQEPGYCPGVWGSEVDVPIRIGGKVIGVLSVENAETNAFSQDDFEVLTAAAHQAGLAIEKAQLLAAERQRADELEALRTTMADVTAELELPSLLQAIVERAAGLLDATGGELGLYDEASHQVRIVVSHNLGEGYLGTRHALGEGAMGRVAETRQPLIIDDYHMWEARSPQYADIQIRASLAAPLMVGGRLVGVITIATTDLDRQFDPADLHLLNLFAQQAAIAIQNAQLYDQAQREISERERAEAELRTYQEHLEELVAERTADLRESEERYRTLFDGMPVGIYRSTPGGQMVDVNPALVEMLGHPNRKELLALNTANFYVDPEERVGWKTLMEREGVLRDFEARLRRYDGGVIWVRNTARAVKDEQGQVLYYEGSLEDITERKRAEAELQRYHEHLAELVEERTSELRESEKRYRTLFDGVPVGLYRATPDGQIVEVNPALVGMLGYPSRKALVAVNMADLSVESEERIRWQEWMERDGLVRDFEARLQRYDGEVIWISDTARVVKDEQGRAVYFEGTAQDITERKRFEEETHRQKEYFEALFVNSPVAALTADLESDVVSWNPMAEKVFGYTQEEAIGQNVDDLVARDPRIREEALHCTKQVLTEGRTQAITKRSRKDGSLVDVHCQAFPVIVAGEMVGYIATYHDISELQLARRTAEAANQAKSQFLAHMSHELRTPLNAILGFTQLMNGDPNLTAEQRENLGIINRSGEHLLALINDVLEMSKIEAGRVTLQERSFDLYRLLDTTEEVFRLRAEDKGLGLSFERGENVPQYVRTDEGKLRQVLMNLLGNAVKFTSEGGVALRIRCSLPRREEEEEEAWLRFEMEDTGPGIAQEELEAVFEPFVQTASGQRSLEGTGLGLSISRQFARLMGGDITVSSELGQGSVFRFEVPIGLAGAARDEMARPSRPVIGLEPGQAVYRLLIVDDRETTRQLLIKLLEPLGFEIREATHGLEAIEIWEGWEPHLIWMDMRMPVMDGYEATQQIKATAKGQTTVILALTASAFEEDRETILSAGCDDIVRKPFRKEEIYAKLAQHLGIRYVYGDEPTQPTAPTMSARQVLTPAAMTALPPDWLAELEQATIKADLDVILGLVDRLPEQHAALADALACLANDFEYREILSLIDQAGGHR
jgi:PAS domain S-box-containing protein